MTDILARIRAWADDLAGAPDSMLGPFLADEIRRRFPEAFTARPSAAAQAPSSTVLAPGSPEYVATMLLAKGPCDTREIVKVCIAAGVWDRHRISDDLTDALKVAGMAYWDTLRSRWVITTAGLAEAGRHAAAAQAVEVRPAKLLETGSPEQVALDFLVLILPDGTDAESVSIHVKKKGAWRNGDSIERILSRRLRRKGLVHYVRGVGGHGCWFATDAGRAEAAKHEAKP